MIRCPKCSHAMVKANLYALEEIISLVGGRKFKDSKGNLLEWWVCINLECEDGAKNVKAAQNNRGNCPGDGEVN